MYKRIISSILIVAFLNFTISPYLLEAKIKINIALEKIVGKALDVSLFIERAQAATEPPCNNVNDDNKPGARAWNAITSGGVNLSNGNFFRVAQDLSIPCRGSALNIARTYNTQPTNIVAGWTPEAGSWGIENNEYSGEGDRSLSQNSYSDFTLQAKVKTITPGEHFDYEVGWINFRYTDKNNRYYFLIHANGELELSKYVGGNRYNLVRQSSSYNPLNWNTVKIEASGSNIKIYINGSLQINFIDTSSLIWGKIALESYFCHTHYDDIAITAGSSITYNFNQQTDQEKSIFGYGWTFNYGMRVIEYADGYVLAYRSDGGIDVYTPKAGGGWVAPIGVYDTLTKNSSGYTITTKYGIKFNFDLSGKLISVEDKNNNQITLTYDSALRLTTITDPSGRQIIFAYGVNGKVSSLTDPAGRHIYYDYDADANLIKVTDPKGSFIEYSYYPTHNIKAWSDKEGRIFTNTYYYNDRVATQTDPLGNITTISYNWEQTTVTNHKGEKYLYTFDAKDRFYWVKDPLGKIEGRAWDDKNNLIGIDDKNGHRTNFEYDQQGNQTKIIKRGSGSSGDLVTEITYEYAYSQPIRQIDPLGNKTEFEYDLKGNAIKTKKYLKLTPSVTEMAYDNYGNLVTVKDAAGNRASFTYDTYGNKLTAADALGNTITLSYDILGRVLSGKDAKGNITTYEYDSIGNLIKTINPLGHQTINTYNKNGAVISSVDSNGNVTTYDYDGLGNLIKTIDPLSNINVVEYDASNYMYDGRVAKTKIIDPLGNSVTYEYDSLGRRIRVIDALGNATSSEYDNVGNLTKVIDALGSVTAIEYDYFYRKTKIYDPLGHARSLTYDDVGNILTVTDANSHMTSYEYDTLYRRIKVIDPQLNITNYSYDVLGNLTAAVDAHSNRIQTTYDSLSRKISTDDPDLGYWAYEYDALGNLIKQTDAKGQVLTFEYDALNRLTKKLNSTTPIVTYYYDDYDNPAIPDFKGKLTKAVDLSGQTVFYYDKLGRETRTEKTVDGVTYVIERIYDKNSRLSAIKYPDAEIVNYTYDAAGNIKTIAGSQNYISNVDYNAKGQMKTLSFGNNTKTEYDYYSDLRLKELKTTQNSTGQVIQKLVYNFDNVGNIAAIADHVNSATQAFSYDSLDRLTQAAGTYGRQTYQYDALGNMLLKDGVNYYYGQNNSKPHAVTSGSDGFYAAYDNNGNMVEKNQAIYEYDIENRLTKIRKEAGNRVTVSMQLKPGWNLFSLPVIPDNPKISAVLSGLNFATDYDELARFNAETQSFQYYFGDPQFNQFDTLSYGIGYEIYITNANPVTLTVTGNLPPANYKVPLKEGWNLIGSSVLTSTSMQTALNNLSFGADYDNISRYDLATSTFKAAATMEKGSGYFIYCLKDTVWNIEGSTTSTQTQSQFIYDGDGGRVKVITPVLTTTYIGSLFEKDSRGKITKHIYLGPNKICSKDSTGNSYYIHPDHLGSSNITTNQTGAQVSLTEFTPYGSTFKQVGTYDPKYKFTGKELDAAGLYFYGARYYDPQIGRFISADTIVQRLYDPQSFNRYAYCRNNPIKYTDPTGHSWWNDFWDKVEEFFEDVFEDVGDFFEDVWEEIKAPLIAAAAAIASIILMVIPGGQPLAVLTWQTTWVAAMSAAATVVTLDTGEGRQLIRRVGNEFFDDVLGMRPATAYTWANITTYMAVNMAYQFTFANILNPAKVTDKQPYNSGSDKAIARDLSENGGGFNYGTQPSIDKTGALQHVDNVLYSNGKAVGLSAEALYIGGQPQHLGVVMRGLTYNINSGALLGEPIKALLHGYGVLGISHTAVNITLLNAGYSSTISSIGGGWSTYFSTFIYGPYGGNAVTSVVYNTGTEQ